MARQRLKGLRSQPVGPLFEPEDGVKNAVEAIKDQVALAGHDHFVTPQALRGL